MVGDFIRTHNTPRTRAVTGMLALALVAPACGYVGSEKPENDTTVLQTEGGRLFTGAQEYLARIDPDTTLYGAPIDTDSFTYTAEGEYGASATAVSPAELHHKGGSANVDITLMLDCRGDAAERRLMLTLNPHRDPDIPGLETFDINPAVLNPAAVSITGSAICTASTTTGVAMPSEAEFMTIFEDFGSASVLE